MKAKLILPALTEALSPFWRPIKYHLFPPLGLATIAAFFDPEDEVDLQVGVRHKPKTIGVASSVIFLTLALGKRPNRFGMS